MDWLGFQKEFESFVGVNLWTMLFAWINLLILYIVLKKILFRPIKNMIDSRQKEVDDMYDNAHKAEESAEQMKADYEAKLKRANEESEEILKSAVRRAQLREEEILRDANAKAARTRARAEEQIELEKKKALNDIKDEISGIAADIAGAVIEREVSPDEHAEIIDAFIRDLDKKD